MFLSKKFLYLFLFSLFLFPQKIFSAGDCRSYFGSNCVSSPSDCAENQYYDSMADCSGGGGTVCCRLKEEKQKPKDTDPKTKGCIQNNGACFPSSTPCYGGLENKLPYTCGDNQHCCKKTVNSCQANGGICLDPGWKCEKTVLYYACENKGVCCGEKKKEANEEDGDAWGKGLENANQAANLPDTDFIEFLNSVLRYLLSLFTILGVLFFVITGLKYIIGGATNTIEESKLGFKHLILGVAIGLSGYIIIKLIDSILQGSFLLYF